MQLKGNMEVSLFAPDAWTSQTSGEGLSHQNNFSLGFFTCVFSSTDGV